MKISRRQFIKQSLLLGSSLFVAPGCLSASFKEKQKWVPAYAILEQQGRLKERIEEAYAIFEECRLCPRECGVNRLRGERGFCRAPSEVMVYVAQPHFGEEISLVGHGGSGTIFFSNCNLRCVFCQNWPIAHRGEGKQITDDALSDMMLFLQRIGCHNINLVTPTHVMPNILNATRIAYQKGLKIPLVYNTSGYERVEIVKILDQIVDIYLPDMKYTDPEKAALYSAEASDYPEVTQKAILEMHRQVGLHTVDDDGIALKGLMIRHLVMPNGVAGTEKFVKWVAEALPKSTYVNIMAQYHVDYRAFEFPEIARGITAEEFLQAMKWAEEYGLTNLDPRSKRIQDFYLRS
ncbi:MAG: radical SAM protein [Deltaproteobacteria bacterium]|nr:radical SAM protein [Deltaproteobacteria bacterium]MBW1994585.1 radical SAM protein [Deltaproteobacteria bacterium]MBW2151055.1 radical SAM protein [Deltaproteobacteria bacterium]